MVVIVLPRPSGTCLRGRLSSNVRRHKRAAPHQRCLFCSASAQEGFSVEHVVLARKLVEAEYEEEEEHSAAQVAGREACKAGRSEVSEARRNSQGTGGDTDGQTMLFVWCRHVSWAPQNAPRFAKIRREVVILGVAGRSGLVDLGRLWRTPQLGQTEVTPNPSLEPTRYGRRRLAAPGHRDHCPSAASRHLPQRAAQLER